MKYKMIESNDILGEIEKNIYNDIFTIIKSEKVVKFQQYPFSNILLVPTQFSDEILDYLSSFSTMFLAIKENELKSIFK